MTISTTPLVPLLRAHSTDFRTYNRLYNTLYNRVDILCHLSVCYHELMNECNLLGLMQLAIARHHASPPSPPCSRCCLPSSSSSPPPPHTLPPSHTDCRNKTRRNKNALHFHLCHSLSPNFDSCTHWNIR